MELEHDPVTPLAAGVGASLGMVDGVVSVARGRTAFNFVLAWDDRASGKLAFRSGVTELWSQTLVSDDLISLLLGLAKAWEALVMEEVYPRSVTPDHPSQLTSQLDLVLKDVDEVDLLVGRYRASHDLAAWIDDPDASSLWFMREGLLMIVDSGGIVRRPLAIEVLPVLEQLGDILVQITKGDSAASHAIAAWRDRNDLSAEGIGRLLRLSIGRPEKAVQRLLDNKVIPFPTRRAEIMAGLDEVQAAARMWPTQAPLPALERVAGEIRKVPHRETVELDHLAEQAMAVLRRYANKAPREGGKAVAEWLRDTVGLSPGSRAEPEQLLNKWGVYVHRIAILRDIEAVSFWGGQHGPGILLNPDARRASGKAIDASELNGAMRYSLAHEICHLLLDRRGSLPVAEVLGGATPNQPEKRANVFAAHFLLPLGEVEKAFVDGVDINECIQTLMVSFGVSRSLAAAQLKWRYFNSEILSSADWRAVDAIIRS
jgi:Zn-dependent peptidase ImmA (M78 family)